MAGQRSPISTANSTAPRARDAAGKSQRPGKSRNTEQVTRLSQRLWDNGQPLPPELRSTMQSRFAYDFSHVRIHADDRAGKLADEIGANAFTLNNHVIFGTGRFAPHNPEGRRLIAHELAHVIQQQPEPSDVAVPPSLDGFRLSRPGDTAEREATSAGDSLTHGEVIAIHEHARNTLQADWAGAGIGALVGGALGAIAGGLIGGPIGALVGLGIGLVGGAVIGGVATGGGALFPSYSEIVGNAGVRAAITRAWSSTEAAANAMTRREEGFWIRLNKATGNYEFTGTVLGPSVGPAATGSVVLGSRPADTNPGADNAIYTIASFHTHTPTAFRTVGRAVGPSGADNRADTADDVAGVVYDYVESPAGSGNIPAGHPIGSPAQPYHSGPDRRQRP